MSTDWSLAEPLVKEALEIEPGDPVARSLSSIVDDYRRQDAINSILVEARNLQAEGKIPKALQRVGEGLAVYPNEVRLSQLHNTLRLLSGDARRRRPPLCLLRRFNLHLRTTLHRPSSRRQISRPALTWELAVSKRPRHPCRANEAKAPTDR